MPIDFESLAWSSVWGVIRGISVHSLIYPLEVVKIRQQCSENESKAYRITLDLFRNEGVGAFYKGLPPQLMKTSIKQIWCWPMIIGLPADPLTGLTIATIDAVISAPLERAKILSAFKGTNQFHLKEGWKGFATDWSKLSVNWITFLTAQKYLRDRSDQPLTYYELTKIGVQVAMIVSLVSAPFDIANTLKQAKNVTPQGVFRLYRGWPLNGLALVVHNIASVTLIEKLSRI